MEDKAREGQLGDWAMEGGRWRKPAQSLCMIMDTGIHFYYALEVIVLDIN